MNQNSRSDILINEYQSDHNFIRLFSYQAIKSVERLLHLL